MGWERGEGRGIWGVRARAGRARRDEEEVSVNGGDEIEGVR